MESAYMRYALWEAVFVWHKGGTVNRETWRQACDGAERSTATGPDYRRFWSQERSGHAPSFQKYIDAEIFTGEQETA